jgi:hypothetical protein
LCVDRTLFFGLGQSAFVLLQAFSVILQLLCHFLSIRRFCLKPAIFLTLKRDIPRPEGIAWQRAAVGLIVLHAGTADEAKHEEAKSVK